MDLVLRPALPADHDALRAIAAAGGSPDGDDRYFDFVRSVGRLTVAVANDAVVGFAGAVPVSGAAMVSDLFVDPTHRAQGVGRRLLHALLDHPARLTFSSTHPAALRLYAEFGMAAGERLLTMEGVAVGGGEPLVAAQWGHDRHQLIDHFRGAGALVTDHSVVHRRAGAVEVWRVQGDESPRALADIVTSHHAGDTITLAILESHPLVAWLERQGFRESGHDVWCRSPDVDTTTVVTCVHAGLC